MRIQYTTRATKSLGDIAIYLRKNSLDSVFIKNYIEEIREEIKSLLSIFPEAGVEKVVDSHHCRRIMIKKHSVLYRYFPEKKHIHILLVYRSNIPKLQ